ncbi:MAG: GxxExxY protein [Chloroflexota bacterium]
MSEIVIVEKELSYQIMQATFEVHNTLGPGFPEAIYDEAMARELTARGMAIERQKRVVVVYKGKPLGEFVLDCVIEGRVILEYKAVVEILRIHEQQALSYLKATGLQLAIVINFGAERVQSSRVVYTNNKAKLPPRPLATRNPPRPK